MRYSVYYSTTVQKRFFFWTRTSLLHQSCLCSVVVPPPSWVLLHTKGRPQDKDWRHWSHGEKGKADVAIDRRRVHSDECTLFMLLVKMAASSVPPRSPSNFPWLFLCRSAQRCFAANWKFKITQPRRTTFALPPHCPSFCSRKVTESTEITAEYAGNIQYTYVYLTLEKLDFVPWYDVFKGKLVAREMWKCAIIC